MASHQHTEKFIVKVEYNGSRRTFEELFDKRGWINEFEATSVEHSLEKIPTKSIRSMDEKIVRKLIKQAVENAGYEVGNIAKHRLKENQARVDYSSESQYYNHILYDHYSSSCPMISIFLPHAFICVKYNNPNLIVKSGWYCLSSNLSHSKPLGVHILKPKSNTVGCVRVVYNSNSSTLPTIDEKFCFSDPDIQQKLTECILKLDQFKSRILENTK